MHVIHWPDLTWPDLSYKLSLRITLSLPEFLLSELHLNGVRPLVVEKCFGHPLTAVVALWPDLTWPDLTFEQQNVFETNVEPTWVLAVWAAPQWCATPCRREVFWPSAHSGCSTLTWPDLTWPDLSNKMCLRWTLSIPEFLLSELHFDGVRPLVF